MIQLFEIFDRHAPGAAPAANDAEQTGSASGGSAHEDATLALEYRDNPFTSFIRLVKAKLETDPNEALRMLENVREAKLFNKSYEKEQIKEALNKAVNAVHREQPQGLVATFFRSVLDLPATPVSEALHPQNPATHLRPTFMNPALNPSPFPAFA